jgi:O-antigen ligase
MTLKNLIKNNTNIKELITGNTYLANFFLILISSVIPFLIWGPFLPDLIISLSSLSFLIYVFRNRLFYFLNKKPLIIFFIFCAYCILVSIFVAKDTLLSFESSLFYFRIGVFACFIWYLIEKDKRILNYFYYALIISFSALAIDGYYQYFFGYNIFGWPLSDNIRVSSFFGKELIMGSYLSRLLPLLFALFVCRKTNKLELYYILILYFLIDVLIYLSAERTSFFFLNLSTIFIIILIKKFQRFRLVGYIISSIVIGFLTFNSDSLKERMILGPVKSIKNSIFTDGHESLILTAYNMFKDKPVFGHGPKMFRVICKDEKYATGISPCTTHPHNFYAQLLAETGIIGFMFLLSALIYVLYCAIKQLKTIIFKEKRYLTDYQVCLLAGILITVWPLSPNGNFFNNWLAICYSLPVGFYLHSIYGKNKEEFFKN